MAQEQPRRRWGGWWLTGVYAGRIFGVPVYFAPSWFLMAVALTLFVGPVMHSNIPGISTAGAYGVAALFAVLLYLSVLIHEISHSVVALRLGLPVRRITLQLFGGLSEIGREAESPSREYLIAVVGPLTSIVIAGVARVAQLHLGVGSVPAAVAYELWVVNGFVAVFNALPALPLDGGRVLRAAVWRITGDKAKATLAAAWMGRLLAVALVAAAVLLPQSAVGVAGQTSYYFLYALYIALILWTGATQAMMQARVSAALPRLDVRRLARPALAVPSDLPVAEAVRRAHEAGARAVVVVDGHGHPEGIVSEAAVVAVPEQRRPWIEVSRVARHVEEGLILSWDLTGQELLTAIQRLPASEYLVVDAAGALYGVLAQADVAAALQATA
jgi:Zn-dependent protease